MSSFEIQTKQTLESRGLDLTGSVHKIKYKYATSFTPLSFPYVSSTFSRVFVSYFIVGQCLEERNKKKKKKKKKKKQIKKSALYGRASRRLTASTQALNDPAVVSK